MPTNKTFKSGAIKSGIVLLTALANSSAVGLRKGFNSAQPALALVGVRRAVAQHVAGD